MSQGLRSSARRLASSSAGRTGSSSSSSSRKVGSKSKREETPSSSSSKLVSEIIAGIHRRADPKTKDWFTNYVKGTTWVGCKLPTVRQAVKEACSSFQDDDEDDDDDKRRSTSNLQQYLVDSAIELLQQDECDIKLSGMLLLSENLPIEQLATEMTLQRIEDDILLCNHIQDWSTADWFANKVLRKIVFFGKNHQLVYRVLDYTKICNTNHQNYLYVRRCGVVSFLEYPKHRMNLPSNFINQLLQACEQSLKYSPEERFTQTGIAWVLRYVLLEKEDCKDVLDMIIRNSTLWNKEAKKSLVEKLGKNDPRRDQILSLGGRIL